MSDKIMELACKAYNTDPIPVGWHMSEKALEKFAELVAATCVEIVEAQKITWSNTPVPAEVALDLTSKAIASYFDLDK